MCVLSRVVARSAVLKLYIYILNLFKNYILLYFILLLSYSLSLLSSAYII